MEPTRIVALETDALDIPLHEPFGIAGGAQLSAENLLVTAVLADGTRGYGEAAPFPAFNGETQARARAAIEAARTWVEGADVRDWRALAGRLFKVIGDVGAARCAIEVAVLDALTKRAGMPLWAMFGGASRSLTTDVTLTTGSVESAELGARKWSSRGFTKLKIKLGGGDLQTDIERVWAASKAAPSASILLDGNAGFSAEDAIEIVRELTERGVTITHFEQPVGKDDLAGMSRVGEHARVIADESCTCARDVVALAASRAAHVVNVKLMKSGVVEALAIVETARAVGLGLMIGGMVEAKLAMSASACFAAGLGGFEVVDLDTPLFLTEDPFVGGYAQTGERLELAGIEAGHGITPRAAIR